MRRLMIIAVLVPACEQVKKVSDGDGACVPAEVQAAFDRSCGPASCHTNGGMQGMLSLGNGQAADAIGRAAVGSPLPLIELGNTAGSYLAQKLMSNPVVAITGDRMPQGFSETNDNQVADVNTILTWIGGGLLECAAAESTGSGTTGEPELPACGLEDLAPGTPSMIVAGSGADQVPPDIATILENNCGCHFTNTYPTPPPYIDYQEGTALLDMRTVAGFRAPNAAMQPFTEVTLGRLMGAGGLIAMPPTGFCADMPPADSANLVQWLMEDAPDGATWTGGSASPHVCGIEDLKSGAPNPILSGSGAGQIPSDIGTILGNNCGCHYADDLDVEVPDYLGTADIATHAGFQAPFGADPLHVTALRYLNTDFMPLGTACELPDGDKIDADDFQTLVQWLGDGAPDGATWEP